MEKIKKFIKKYFVDIIIQLGLFILINESIGIKYTPSSNRFNGLGYNSPVLVHSAQIKIFAIMLISVGINIAVRKYFHSKKV